MKFTYNVGDKLIAKEIKTIGNIFNRYVPAGSVVTLLENINIHNGYELIKVKTPDGINFATSAAYFEAYKEDKHISKNDKKLINLIKFLKDNLKEEDLDEFITTAATVIENAYPGFLEKYNKNKEKCCEEDSCNCSEDCNCLCEDCDCEKDEKVEETFSEVEAYSGQLYCVKPYQLYFTEKRIYKIVEGFIECDDGWQTRLVAKKGRPGEFSIVTTAEEAIAALGGDWIEIKEEIKLPTCKLNPYEGKVICIYGKETEYFTKGNIYTVKNGIFYDEKGNAITYWTKPFETLKEINEYCSSEFAEIKE